MATSRTAEGRRRVPADGAVPVVRASPGRIRVPLNQPASAGWWTSTGERVVGRSTPLRVTVSRTRELTSVDLPAPVEPPTTASSGASSASSRGQDVVVQLFQQRGLRAPGGLGPGQVERQRRLLHGVAKGADGSEQP